MFTVCQWLGSNIGDPQAFLVVHATAKHVYLMCGGARVLGHHHHWILNGVDAFLGRPFCCPSQHCPRTPVKVPVESNDFFERRLSQ